MREILLAIAFGLGVLLVFDGLTRPPETRRRLPAFRLAPNLAGAVGGALAGFLATRWVAATLGGAFLGFFLPRAFDVRRSQRLRTQRREALAEVSARLRDSVRAGMGLTEGLALVAPAAPDVLRRHLSDLAAESRTMGLSRSGQKFASRMDDPLADLFVKALRLADRLGSSGITEVLDGLCDAASGLAITAREVRAKQLRQKLAARIVAAVPLILLLVIRFTDPEYLAPYSSALGQLVLSFGLLLIGFGYWVMVATSRSPEVKREGGRW